MRSVCFFCQWFFLRSLGSGEEAKEMESTKPFVLDAQGEEDLLKEALRNTRDQAFRMKRSMDTGELNGVLKHAAEVLRELRTSLLSPKNYYQLCAFVSPRSYRRDGRVSHSLSLSLVCVCVCLDPLVCML